MIRGVSMVAWLVASTGLGALRPLQVGMAGLLAGAATTAVFAALLPILMRRKRWRWWCVPLALLACFLASSAGWMWLADRVMD